jgi:CDP-diacylglycerol---glycerol-3-phosphate 3-phosphatidyltransferase
MLKETIGRPIHWLLNRIVSGLASTGIPPNVLTWSILFLNLWAGILFAFGRFAAAGGMMIAAGFFDMVDGPVARKQGRVSQFGGFLDSMLDRYSDLILFLGLLVYYAQVNRFLYDVLVGAAMAGSVMVSYAKARAESLIGSCEVGFWERPERIVLMILGALTNRMELALWLLAIGPNITVVHRILDTWRRTKDIEKLADAAQPAAESARAAQAAKAATEVRRAPVFTRHAGRGA